MTRNELINAIATMTNESKSKLIIRKTVDLQNIFAKLSARKPKKTTRTCVICGCDKPLDEFGPTHKQVACKGECLKTYSVAARARRKARLENQARIECPIAREVGLVSSIIGVEYFDWSLVF